MKKLIEFLKQIKKYNLKYIEQNFLTNEVKEVLFKYSLTIHELCYRLKNNIDLDKQFFCKQCGTKIVFDRKHHYKDFCNKKCSGKYSAQSESIKKRIATNMERYGVSCTLQDKNVHQKVLETWKQKYNTDSPNKSNIVKAKKKQAYLKKFGVDNYSKTKEYKEKVKQTNIEKFGKESYTQTDEYKDRVKQTCLENYGVDHYTKTQKYRDFIKEHYDEIQIKSYNTKQQHNSFHTSKAEEKVYKFLLTKFTKDDIERQYRSKLYSFNCDFYIKSLDLYIEYNGTWTHGSESFNKDNSEHIKLLKYWRKKAEEINFKGEKKNYFKSAIYTWTILDVKKLETFKKNKLNYKIFWNIKEVEDWLTSQV